MTDRIEPAMTAAEFRNEGMDDPSVLGDIRYVERPAHLAKIIALANDLLPDDDPRKITRKTIAMLRNAAGERSVWASTDECEWEIDATSPDEDALNHLADVLESYLPPE